MSLFDDIERVTAGGDARTQGCRDRVSRLQGACLRQDVLTDDAAATVDGPEGFEPLAIENGTATTTASILARRGQNLPITRVQLVLKIGCRFVVDSRCVAAAAVRGDVTKTIRKPGLPVSLQ